jgi:heme exporter protein A
MPQTTIFVRPPGVPESAPAAVETRDLSRLFGGGVALGGLSVRIEPGAAIMVEGGNGAGKTTLLRILATALRPSFGTVMLDGIDALASPELVRPRIGFLGHATALYDDLTAVENLRFAATMSGIPSPDVESRIEAALVRVEMTAAAGHRVRGFSAGMRRRVALARLLLGHPRLVLLDEPLTALDVSAVDMLDGLLADWASQGATVVIASHLGDRLSAPTHGNLRLENGRLAEVSGPGIARVPATPSELGAVLPSASW